MILELFKKRLPNSRATLMDTGVADVSTVKCEETCFGVAASGIGAEEGWNGSDVFTAIAL